MPVIGYGNLFSSKCILRLKFDTNLQNFFQLSERNGKKVSLGFRLTLVSIPTGPHSAVGRAPDS